MKLTPFFLRGTIWGTISEKEDGSLHKFLEFNSFTYLLIRNQQGGGSNPPAGSNDINNLI
jgi:hypothetical protein